MNKYFKILVMFFISILISTWSLFPILWFLIVSLTTLGSLPTKIALPSYLTLDPYIHVLFGGYFSGYALNSIIPNILDSIIITFGSCFLTLIVSIFPSYAFSRYNFNISKTIYNGLLIVRMIPFVALVPPYFIIFNSLKLIDTYQGCIFAITTLQIPPAIWILKGFFDSIPKEIEEQAMIDGASLPRRLLIILIPVIMPGISVVLSLTFVFTYIHYILYSILSRGTIIPISVRIVSFMQEGLILWNEMAAATMISIAPMILFLLFFGKYFIKGITMGAIKG